MFFRIQPGLPQKCWSHHLPRGVLRPGTGWNRIQRVPGGFRDPFRFIFFASEFRSHMWTAHKLLLGMIFSICGRPGVNSRRFWISKQVPAAYFFGVFSKTVIL